MRASEDPSIDGMDPVWNHQSFTVDARGRPGLNSTKAQEKGNLIVHFHPMEVIDQDATNKAARPIYKTVDCIMLITPGDKDNVVDREVWDDKRHPQSDTVRFAKEWEQYQKMGEQSPDNIPTGQTPLTKVAFLSRARVLEWRWFSVFSVEQLSDVSDQSCQKMMGANTDRQMARDYLASANGTVGMFTLRDENEKMRKEMEMLKEQLALLSKRQDAKEEEPSPGVRRRKAVEAAMEPLRADIKKRAPAKKAATTKKPEPEPAPVEPARKKFMEKLWS
jgi:hypothetical protein